jgi:hypothetical protein
MMRRASLRTLEILIDLGRCHPAGEVAEARTTTAVDEDDDKRTKMNSNAPAKMRAST